ncbi:allatostatin-A receptor-like [Acanthaster planci]|uniref:Allatostatin-A receptor-like n=1 Tax=Acanthaster planci TaxID=133434 RepID=A0A8B7XNK7_ACAPL|nr:allatostatin-A receptor-like [Acanthaster planci]
MLSYLANVTVYAPATASIDQLDMLMCTFFICVFQNHTQDCSVAYSLPQLYHPLIWDARGPAPGTLVNESLTTQSSAVYRLFNHSLQIRALESPAEADDFVYSGAQSILYGFVLPIVKLFGLLSNLSFFFTLLRVPSMRNVTNFYLSNVAVADLLVLIFATTSNQCQVLTTHISVDMSSLGNSPQVVYSLFVYLLNVGTISSFVFVTVLSYERCFAIYHPFEHHAVNLKKRAIKVAVCFWLLSLSVNAAFFWFQFEAWNVPPIKCLIWPSEEKYKHLSSNVKVFVNSDEMILTWLQVTNYVLFCIYGLCLVLTVIFNVCLIKQMHAPFQGNMQIRGPSQNQRRATVILGINTTVVFLCFLPQIVITLVLILCGSSDGLHLSFFVEQDLLLIVSWLRIINASINSVIFNAGSGSYRKAFKQAFCCSKRQQGHRVNIALQTLPRADVDNRI